MTKQITVTVIHNCKKCKDEGVLIVKKEIVHCDLCLGVGSDKEAKSWFEIKEDGTIGVKAGIHLEKPFGMPWQQKL